MSNSLHCPLWLGQRSPQASLSTSHKTNQNQWWRPRALFSAFDFIYSATCIWSVFWLGDCAVCFWRWFVTLRLKGLALFPPRWYLRLLCLGIHANNDISGKDLFEGECMTSVSTPEWVGPGLYILVCYISCNICSFVFFLFFVMRFLPPARFLSLSSAKSARNSNERF